MDFNDYTYPRDAGLSVLDWFGDDSYAKPKGYITQSELHRLVNALRCEGDDMITDELRDAAAKHAIEIYDVKQGAGGKWFIKCKQLVNEDGCGVFASYQHTDLHEMVEILYKHFSYNEEIDLMNIFSTNLFKYLAGEMFLSKTGAPVVAKLTIKNVKLEAIPNGRGGMDEKPVMSFKERDKLLVLNKTNAKAIVGMYGGETDNWIGKPISVTAERGTWFGKSGVRVIVLDHVANGNGKQAVKPVEEITPDDIEFDDVMEDITGQLKINDDLGLPANDMTGAYAE